MYSFREAGCSRPAFQLRAQGPVSAEHEMPARRKATQKIDGVPAAFFGNEAADHAKEMRVGREREPFPRLSAGRQIRICRTIDGVIQSPAVVAFRPPKAGHGFSGAVCDAYRSV